MKSNTVTCELALVVVSRRIQLVSSRNLRLVFDAEPGVGSGLIRCKTDNGYIGLGEVRLDWEGGTTQPGYVLPSVDRPSVVYVHTVFRTVARLLQQ